MNLPRQRVAPKERFRFFSPHFNQFWQFRRPTLLGIIGLVLGAWLGGQAAERPQWHSNRVNGSPNPPTPYVVERVFPKLKFDHPVDMALMPGSDRLWVLEQGGRLVSFHSQASAESEDLAVNLREHHQPFDSAYGIAFHPKFSENHYVFLCYVEPGGRENGTIVSRFTVSASEPPVIDPKSEKVLVRWLSGGHNGGALAFGNDGMLYISAGDAANPDPPDMPYSTGQDISDLLSSVLRIDVDHEDGGRNYSIPKDNPFLTVSGARPEVYAFGFRNPWRISFDRPTGELWVGDVGWEQWEMIYHVKKGGNYGWSITEGPNTQVRTDVNPGPAPILPPMVALPHSQAASISGGRVYHGGKLPRLKGAYLYGDWETGIFWALRNDGDKLVSNEELCDTTLKPVAFGEDQKGEVLIVDYNGGLYAFVTNTASTAATVFPRRLSEAGIFSDLPALKPAPGVEPYRINSPKWDDYAQAERVMGVPGNEAIATANGRETIIGRVWYFPSNTVFARTLSLEMTVGQPATKRRIETQMMHFDGQTWNAYTYRWNAAQTDADLVSAEGTNDVFNVTDASAPGGKREIPWRYLSRAECLRCHNVWAGDLLSFSLPQLNTPGDKSELQRFVEMGLLNLVNPPAPMPRLAGPHDTSATVEDRARSWLHVNCSGCHRYGAGGGVPAQLNNDQPLEKSRTVDAPPTRGDFGIHGAQVVAAGDPYRSVLFYRVNTEGSGHMPHIGSRLADEQGVTLLRDWIRSLPAKAGGEEAGKKLADDNAVQLARLAGATRADAITRLIATMNGGLALFDRVREPSADSGLRKDATTAALASANPLVRDLFQRLLPTDQRRRTLGANIDANVILARKGNAERGRELFMGAAQCSNCHVCDGAGRAFGPELTGVARKYTRPQVLDQILRPSQIIAPEFKSITLEMQDDSELTGFIIKRSPEELVLRDAGLVEHHVPVKQIRKSRESSLSAMPEGLLAPLTEQEAADLLEFLCRNTTASR